MIDRINYIEYFLLYVDDELSLHQRSEVEIFVNENADLMCEFEMLKQTKLIPHTIEFADKKRLLKKESFINQDNYVEYFLLYIDKELSNRDAKAVEDFIFENPLPQKEFIQLKETVLKPEEIKFPGKESLLKKRKAISLQWVRLAAAAAFIGIVFLIWRLIPANNQRQQIASAMHKQTLPTKAPGVIVTHQSGNNVINQHSNEDVVTISSNHKKINATKIIQQKTLIQSARINETTVAQNKGQHSNSDQIIAQQAAQQTPEENKTALNPLQEISAAQRKMKDANYAEKVRTDVNETPVYKEISTENETDNSPAFYISSIPVNKNKVKGFLRKASHLIRFNEDDNKKLEVANLKVNTPQL